ncbi:MAG: hypothetical protein KDA52_16920 [Planctomycetaceae bacterium]|nr:hypothetical protein [Planctomycetaceae bacterium]
MIKSRLQVLLLVLPLLGCNYVSSGTYDDDPRTWTWAFGESEPPDGITINKSKYWSSAHFTAEYIWHFDLTLTDEAVTDLIANPDVKRLDTPPDPDDAGIERPVWFLPDGTDGYTAFQMDGEEEFVMYVNLETGRSFWSAWLL